MLRPQCRAALDGSFTAPVLLPLNDAADPASNTQIRQPGRGARNGSATAMSIPFAPEPEPAAEVLYLDDDQPTGPLPLGFEFEFFGGRYARFDLSSAGFITFRTEAAARSSSGPHRSDRLIARSADGYSSIALGWSDLYPLRGRHLAYEVRGDATRRRLVLSLRGTPHSSKLGVRRLTAQLILYERTGMIDVHITGEDADGHSVSREALRFTTAPW
jgi:hypothetical protein